MLKNGVIGGFDPAFAAFFLLSFSSYKKEQELPQFLFAYFFVQRFMNKLPKKINFQKL